MNTIAWVPHEIENNIIKAHSFALGDLDMDGDLDIFAAEMTNWDIYVNSNAKMRIYKNNGDKTFATVSFPTGINNHESKLGDFNGDGRLDILSKSYSDYNPPAPKLIIWLQNGITKNVTNWQYKRVDTTREKYGSWYGWFGIAFADRINDEYKDIISGKYYYKNPGGDMMGTWTRTTFPVNVDASLVTNVDGDANIDVIGFGFTSTYTPNPGVYWLEKTGAGDTTKDWTATRVVSTGTILPTYHSQPQGFRTAQIIPGGREEIVLTGNNPGKLFFLEIPANPEAGNWPVTVISSHNTQGLAVGDINKDGYIDIVGVNSSNNGIFWWENPGIARQINWSKHFVGNPTPITSYTGSDGPDRIELADLNGDRLLDIVMTDEVSTGTESQLDRAKSRTYWFAQPVNVDSAGNWGISKQIVEQQSTNSLDVADIDNDGDVDVVTAELKGNEELTIWTNNGIGIFAKNLIGIENESHNGAQLADLDGDGDLDIVSPAWDKYGLLNMWRNDNH